MAVVCAPQLGITAVETLEPLEWVTNGPFSDTPGVPPKSRVRALAKVTGNIMRGGEGEPPLAAGKRGDVGTWIRSHHITSTWSYGDAMSKLWSSVASSPGAAYADG